jgi:hypothetical protein
MNQARCTLQLASGHHFPYLRKNFYNDYRPVERLESPRWGTEEVSLTTIAR